MERVPSIPNEAPVVVTARPPTSDPAATGILPPQGGFAFAGRLQGLVEFNDVTFAYPRKNGEPIPVLHGLSLRVQPGKGLARVGRSGSGKSTCIKLCERFYDVTGGSITIDGIDIKQYNTRWLRKNIGYVSQETVLFNRSVADNIAYGLAKPIDRDAVVEAAKLAHAHEFIEKLPDGYDTVVGEKGAKLSGGQKQRVAIARALSEWHGLAVCAHGAG